MSWINITARFLRFLPIKSKNTQRKLKVRVSGIFLNLSCVEWLLMVCSITLGCWNYMSESQRNPTVPSLQYLYAYVSMHQVNTVYSPFFSATLSFFSVIKKSYRQFSGTSTCTHAVFVIHMQTITFCVVISRHGLTTLTTATDTPILLFRLTAGRPSTLCDVIHSSELQPQRIMERTINSWV